MAAALAFAATFSLSSSLPPHSLSSNLNPIRTTFSIFRPLFPRRPTAGKFSPISSMSNQPPTDLEDKEEAKENNDSLSLSSSSSRSFAVATGELFLGIASRLIGRKNSSPTVDSPPEVPNSGEKLYDGERISTVIEDSMEPGVLWEQREKDVEAEKRRKSVTSPGFSFSAAGLLFPYHLGVAKFLIEKGYIKETTPLAGSSAGAIVCAVIASGRSMQDALQDTKVLAEDCRLRGTAFRLGRSICLEKA